ncbi:hypothetical protein EX30DRAFT_351131 [Ascodesmis nigricans]|uniref:Uncharacterized protein n=1 Tax=Ascodesmis nigricans TaxID=341454 RepID=A0A4S2MMV4_9PEZI|nr:hypothetical protein EX30DRAFT_351131 [Ascodesmis nigricans]
MPVLSYRRTMRYSQGVGSYSSYMYYRYAYASYVHTYIDAGIAGIVYVMIRINTIRRYIIICDILSRNLKITGIQRTKHQPDAVGRPTAVALQREPRSSRTPALTPVPGRSAGCLCCAVIETPR